MKTHTTMSTVAGAMGDLQINSMLKLLITVVDQSQDLARQSRQLTAYWGSFFSPAAKCM